MSSFRAGKTDCIGDSFILKFQNLTTGQNHETIGSEFFFMLI